MNKLKSRKLWVSILTAVISVVGPVFGVPPQAILAVGKIAAIYVGVEGAADIAGALKG